MRNSSISDIRVRISAIALILLLSFAVRGLTAYFIHTHLSDPAWFQSGTYRIFERKAEAILNHKSSLFWIDDPSQTESAVYPPAYPLWIAFIYSITGHHSPSSVQQVQWVLDSLSVLLLVGIGYTAFNLRVGLIAGILAALSPLLTLYGAVPLADSPTSWLVLGAVWLFVAATKSFLASESVAATFFSFTPRFSSGSATTPTLRTISTVFAAGVLVGLSCWFRANAFLLPLFWLGALFFIKATWRTRFQLSSALIIGMLLIIAPLLLRNAVAFHVFVPTGLGAGTNLWEGIGETDRAAEFGAVYGDQNLLEKERAELGVPKDDSTFSLYYPDGVTRDRERTRKALSVISSHPVWYAGVMLRRMAGVLKFAGTPNPIYGSSGINVTSSKCLPVRLQGGVIGGLVNGLGMLQSVVRHLTLPLMIFGVVISLWVAWRRAVLLLSTVLYYLVVGSALHTEIRYGLPMQALLFVFAAVTVNKLVLMRAERGQGPPSRPAN